VSPERRFFYPGPRLENQESLRHNLEKLEIIVRTAYLDMKD
jgi:hypothetical protein